MNKKSSWFPFLIFVLLACPTGSVSGADSQKKAAERLLQSRPQAPTRMTIEEAMAQERLGDYERQTSQDMETEDTFVPGAALARSPMQSGLFNGIFGGHTTFDAQRHGSMHRSIQHGIQPGPGSQYVHVTWTVSQVMVFPDVNRNVHYNVYDWTIPGWTLNIDPFGGWPIVNPGEQGGYTTLDLNSSGNAAVFHHAEPAGLADYTRVARFAIPGMGIHVADLLTNLPGEENLYPRGEVGRSTAPNGDIYHVGSIDRLPGFGNLADLSYWRCVYDAVGGAYVWEGPVVMDQSRIPCQVILANGDRVIYAFAKSRPGALNQYDNDLAYYESVTGGADWITNNGPTPWALGGGWNVTDYIATDLHRCFVDIAGGFTSDGRLHLVYNNPGYDDAGGTVSTGPCELLHWNESVAGGNTPAWVSPGPGAGFTLANFHIITSALWGTPGHGTGNAGASGVWNRHISKPTLAFGDGSTLCNSQPNLDYLYCVYTQFGSQDPLDKADASAAGYQNGNLWMSISDDYGFSWALQKCITTIPVNSVGGVRGPIPGTPTRTPGCDVTAGDSCQSEHWSSAARVVNDMLHVFYVGDLDAGGFVYGEGNGAIDDMMYLPITGDLAPFARPQQENVLCPVECFCGDPFGDLNNDGAVNPVDVVYIVNYAYRDIDGRIYPPDWNCASDLGDVNCDGGINPVDVVYYVNYVYRGLNSFCDPCNQ